MAANLHVGKNTGGPAIRQLAVGEALVTQAQPVRAGTLGLLDGRAHISGGAFETCGVNACLLQHVLQALVNRGLVGLTGAGLSQWDDHAAGAVGIAVVLHIEIAHHAAGLRVHCVQMVALVKGLDAHFPV